MTEPKMKVVRTDGPSSVIVIPARMESQRLPGKPMLKIAGKPLVHWTYDRAKQTEADYVIVATPDREIAGYCRDNGIPWRPTREDHPTGTHRIAEVVRQMKDGVDLSVVVNWQVDEPLVDPEDVNRLIEDNLKTDAYGDWPNVSTLVCMGGTRYEWPDPNCVKVAVGEANQIFWFSRLLIHGSQLHCGIYAFQPSVVLELEKYKPTDLSLAESLEQLTWIEKGYGIRGLQISELPLSINTKTDLERFRKMVENEDD